MAAGAAHCCCCPQMVSTTEHHTTAATGGLVSAAGPQPQQKEYDLNFQRTLLDLMEICQLLHNAKLEMVPVSWSYTRGSENMIQIVGHFLF